MEEKLCKPSRRKGLKGLKLFQEMLSWAVQEREEEIRNLEATQPLLGYVECLEKNESLQNKGKDISEVKHRSRSLKTFNPCSDCALVF